MGQAYMAPSAQHVACCRKSNTMLRMHLAGSTDFRLVSSDAGFCLLLHFYQSDELICEGEWPF